MSIEETLEEVEVLIGRHFFNEFSETQSSLFPKKIASNQNSFDATIFMKTWMSPNCTPKTMMVIRENHENLLCVGKRKELITRQNTDTTCLWSRTGQPLNAKHIISCYKR